VIHVKSVFANHLKNVTHARNVTISMKHMRFRHSESDARAAVERYVSRQAELGRCCRLKFFRIEPHEVIFLQICSFGPIPV
jgi:hypothetical protein